MDFADPRTRPWDAGARDARDERPRPWDIEPVDVVLALFACSAAVLVITAVLHVVLILRVAQMDPAVNTAGIGYGALVMGAALVALPAGLLALRWSRAAPRDAAGDARWAARAGVSDSVEDGLVVAPTVRPAAAAPAPASDTAQVSGTGLRPRSHASTVTSSPARRPVSPPARIAPEQPAPLARPAMHPAPALAVAHPRRPSLFDRLVGRGRGIAHAGWARAAGQHPPAPWLLPQNQ
jgi:hypothetical protein